MFVAVVLAVQLLFKANRVLLRCLLTRCLVLLLLLLLLLLLPLLLLQRNAGYASKVAVLPSNPYEAAGCTGEVIQVSFSAEGRCHGTPDGWCAVATDPAHGEVGLSEHDPALRFVNEGAVGLCFHATRWHVVTRCGVGREEVLDGIHYEAWLRLVWGRRFHPVLLPATVAT